jgi:hypothetical protein
VVGEVEIGKRLQIAVEVANSGKRVRVGEETELRRGLGQVVER